MGPKITKKNQKKPCRSDSEAVSKIKADDATQAKSFYVQGQSLSQICQVFPQYTRAQWRRIKDRESWDQERKVYAEDLKKTAREKLNQSKEQFADSLSSLAEQLHKSVQAGEINFKSVADVEKLLKTIYLHLNDGAEKSQVTVTTGTDWAALAKTLLEVEKKDPALFEKLGAI